MSDKLNRTKKYEFTKTGMTLDPETGTLLTRSGQGVELRPQTREVLRLLAISPGRTVTKDEFFDVVWEGRQVGGDSLVQCIAEIRTALGDQDRTVVRTVPRKGYQFQPPDDAGSRARPNWPRYSARPGVRVVAAGGAIALACLAALLWVVLTSGPRARPAVVAVLPLEDLSPAPHKGYLSDALSEGVITELARSPFFRVVARNSSFQFRDAPTDVREIGEALGAGYVVEGSQQFDGDRIRVTVQLVETETGAHLFADKIERDIDDLFAVQNWIARQVSSVIGQSIVHDMPQQAKKGDVDARLRGLQARKLMTQLTYENWQKALALEDQSIREEPGSAWGYIGKSLMLGTGVDINWLEPRDEVLRDAAALAREALAIAPENYLSHHALARVLSRQGKYSEAISHFERAVELNPSDPIVLIGMSYPLLHSGQTARAIEVLHQAALVDPRHGDWLRWQLGFAYWQSGECGKGLSAMDSMTGSPESSNLLRAALFMCLDRVAEARDAMRTFLRRQPEHTLEKEISRLPTNWKPDAMTQRWISAMRSAGLR